MKLPVHIKNNSKVLQEMMPFVQDICIALRTFIEIDANKQVISNRSIFLFFNLNFV
jgi:hypothetical protein